MSRKLLTALLALGCAVIALTPRIGSALPHHDATMLRHDDPLPQTPVFTTLHRFEGLHGANPLEGLTLSPNGCFYGVTHNGGPFFHSSASLGTVFKITPQGHYTTLSSFSGLNGALPHGPLTLAPDGSLYGVTEVGGPEYGVKGSLGSGTVFRIAPDDTLSTLYHFHDYGSSNRDGVFPRSVPVAAPDGVLYGTTSFGGKHNRGTVYALTPQGTLTVLHDFVGPEGAHPYGTVTRAQDGTLYGTTTSGGKLNNGVIFSLTVDGHERVLHSFIRPDGLDVYSSLAFGPDGALRGVAVYRGPRNGGTIFRITPQGAFSVLHAFTNDGHGANPFSGLTLGADGSFYGTTSAGGASKDAGTVFVMTPAGQVTTLYRFHTDFDGQNPQAGVVFGPDGALYGTTLYGGTYGDGTIYKLTLP